MGRKFHIMILLISFALLFNACRSKQAVIHADFPEYDSAQKIVDKADLIFTGEVIGERYEKLDTRANTDKPWAYPEKDNRLPYTIYEIEVAKVYKGSIEDNIIEIKRLGGEGYVLEGSSNININGNYMFLVATFEHTYPSFLNPDQALYDLDVPEVLSEEDDDKITLSQILEIFDEEESEIESGDLENESAEDIDN